MLGKSVAVAVFNSHIDAERAIKELQKDGYDMKNLSIIGKEYQTEEQPVGYYNTGDRMKSWGKLGAFWGGLWGLLFGAAFFIIPGIGPVAMAGPLVGVFVSGLEGALAVGGLSAFGAALYSIGIPKGSIIRYETALKASKFLVMLHGTEVNGAKAQELLRTSNATEIAIHHV